MIRKPLPPFGHAFTQSRTAAGAWVAIGPGAWGFTRLKPFPVMVLPPDRDPFAYAWPVRGLVVTLIEVGDFDTDRLNRTAYALLLAGARRVIALREALLHERVFPLQVFVRDHDDEQRAA